MKRNRTLLASLALAAALLLSACAAIQASNEPKRNGLIAHRWYGSDGEFMAVDEWPDQESFQAFMEQAQPDIGPVMEAAGVTSQPSVTLWRTLDTGDAVGWGA